MNLPSCKNVPCSSLRHRRPRQGLRVGTPQSHWLRIFWYHQSVTNQSTNIHSVKSPILIIFCHHSLQWLQYQSYKVNRNKRDNKRMKITPAPQHCCEWRVLPKDCLTLDSTLETDADKCIAFLPYSERNHLMGQKRNGEALRHPPSQSVPSRPNLKQETWPLGWHSPAGNSPKTGKQIRSAVAQKGKPNNAVLLGIATDEGVQVAWINGSAP